MEKAEIDVELKDAELIVTCASVAYGAYILTVSFGSFAQAVQQMLVLVVAGKHGVEVVAKTVEV